MKAPGEVIQELQMTEKGTALTASQNRYFFKVAVTANKPEIKHAVETLFKVRVAKVNTMRYAGKPKRERTAGFGRRAAWKRAVVMLREGDRIETT
ncbi:MAG: 50S ribosomal protein L23 [Lentisphaerae bacterium]|nr:50S ribosomal protein L23 [Lentisphaerota bacterium]